MAEHGDAKLTSVGDARRLPEGVLGQRLRPVQGECTMGSIAAKSNVESAWRNAAAPTGNESAPTPAAQAEATTARPSVRAGSVRRQWDRVLRALRWHTERSR